MEVPLNIDLCSDLASGPVSTALRFSTTTTDCYSLRESGAHARAVSAARACCERCPGGQWLRAPCAARLGSTGLGRRSRPGVLVRASALGGS